MPLEEYRLIEAWRQVEDSMNTGKPVKNTKTNKKSLRENQYHADIDDEVEEVEEDCASGGFTAAPGGATKGGEDFEKAGGFRKRIGGVAERRKKKKTEESFEEMGALPAPGMETDVVGMGSSMEGIIDRLKSRFPSADIMLSVKLPSGATFSDAEIEAALDSLDSASYEDEEIVDSEVEDEDIVDDVIGGDDDTEDELEDEAEDEIDDESEDEPEDEMEEGDVLPNSRKPGQGPDEYLRNKPLSEDQHTHPAKGQINKSEYKGNVGIQESDDKDSDTDDDSYVKPDCFTMTVDQWEAFFNNDPFKKGV